MFPDILTNTLMSTNPVTTFKNPNLPVEIVEERQQIKRKLYPTFSLTFIKNIRIHNRGRIVKPWATHYWTLHVSMDVITD